jgi:aspartyl-tRNA(Asn)/glutamyl-tRNA(Gln) amidotransferase subunit C
VLCSDAAAEHPARARSLVVYAQAMSSPQSPSSAGAESALTEAEVLHVAKLARLELSPGELTTMTSELSAIISYVRKLSELDTSDVPPTAQVQVARSPLRSDEPRASLEHDDALAAAPRVAHDGFAVPGFVEE